MANPNLFRPQSSPPTPTDAVNEAGGRAYRLSPKQALAQLAATGCFQGTYYADADTQLQMLIDLVQQVDDPIYLAKLALYAREKAMMKDMPAALLLLLSKRDMPLFHQIFDRVVDNGRMLRTLFQMLRSGAFGRKSLSYGLQRAFQRWLNRASVSQLLSAAIGKNPSLRDVLRAARPTPPDQQRRALFGWLTGRPAPKWHPATWADLPEEVTALIAFRQAVAEASQVQLLERYRFRWDLLADSARGETVWKALARQMGPQALRMNLNTLLRHKVLQDPAMVHYVAQRLADPEEIVRSRQFPYQYLAAYLNADPDLPQPLRDALETATEIACGNVPELAGPIVIGLDVSGSMSCSVTGSRRGGASKMRCIDVAALFAAAIVRRNPGSLLIAFDTESHEVEIDPDEKILALSARLAQYGGGGTDCSIPLRTANQHQHHRQRAFAGCVLISDNESWIGEGRANQTAVMEQWNAFVRNQIRLQGPQAEPKLVCIDLQPYTTVQAPDRADILNVGGFSDAVFTVVSTFLRDDAQHFVEQVEAIDLNAV